MPKEPFRLDAIRTGENSHADALDVLSMRLLSSMRFSVEDLLDFLVEDLLASEPIDAMESIVFNIVCYNGIYAMDETSNVKSSNM